MISAPPQQYKPVLVEKNIQKFWDTHNVFLQSIDQRKNKPSYVFLEGPPTANGMPHPGHVLTRVMKDLVLRYKTMKGFYILRKAGWDTHGLPVEIEVEKKLGLHDKQDVETYGIKKFNEACKKSVFTYEHAWVELSKRIGFWIDMENPYVTLENDYIESVWWSLQQAWKKKLLYKGHKVVPYCPRCGTALSTHEISQGYKEVEDPSIFIKFKLTDQDCFFLAWTTTPWTLISNVALAVHPKETYVKIRYNGECLLFAKKRLKTLLKDEDYELLEEFTGKQLEHITYEPLFTFAKPEKKAWYVVLADFVIMDDGTGIVHIAPAFGEDDYTVGRTYDLPVIQLVTLQGTFPSEVSPWAGQFVKDADPSIIEYLEERGALLSKRVHTHEYPFCWRCNSPLLYYAMESWFIAMTKIQDTLVNNNNQIQWIPAHLQQGRFGDFIRDVKDWALSRNRYWGTPLPIWTCTHSTCRYQHCIGSVEELRSLSKSFPKDYDLHKPMVDELIVSCPKCQSVMQREKEVIDCWYDSGSAFFAQWHYPFEHTKEFNENFPVDFISEALDQTRGWFYSLLAISTFLFEKPAFKTVLTLGLVLDKNNQKMSKSKQNYVDPMIILDNEGADALRWYLMVSNAPWNSTRFFEEAVKETFGKFLLTLYNSYNFFTTYASLDGFTPDKTPPSIAKRPLLDQWILSRFHHLIETVQTEMDAFATHKAARAIESFLIDDLSNWYLRRSRKRLWVEENTSDKQAAYTTMYEIFLGLVSILAPFIPFITEEMYQNLRTDSMPISIHLCDYPTNNQSLQHPDLESGMQLVRELVEAGRALRSQHGVNVRHPLGQAWILATEKQQQSIEPLLDLFQDELNVKKVEFTTSTEPFLQQSVKPNHGKLGPKYKTLAKTITSQLAVMDPQQLFKSLQENKHIQLKIDNQKITLTDEDFTIISTEKPHIALTKTMDMTLVIDLTITPELQAEGFARELIRRIQSMRKELQLDVEAQISTELHLSDEMKTMLKCWEQHIKKETRTHTLNYTEKPTGDLQKTWTINESHTIVAIKKQ